MKELISAAPWSTPNRNTVSGASESCGDFCATVYGLPETGSRNTTRSPSFKPLRGLLSNLVSRTIPEGRVVNVMATGACGGRAGRDAEPDRRTRASSNHGTRITSSCFVCFQSPAAS